MGHDSPSSTCEWNVRTWGAPDVDSVKADLRPPMSSAGGPFPVEATWPPRPGVAKNSHSIFLMHGRAEAIAENVPEIGRLR